MADNDKSLIQAAYINTPFAYTRTQKGLTLLQQNVMVRVSAHLQHFFEKHWEIPELRYSKERPKPVMFKEELDALPPLRIELSELGISSGTYDRLRQSLKEILDVKAEGTIIDPETGKKAKRMVNVFSKIDTPVTDKGTTVTKYIEEVNDKGEVERTPYTEHVERTRGYIEVSINKDMFNSVFDLGQGYVSHPEDIALIGRAENMPLMYYLIRHKMNNFKEKDGQFITEVQVELEEVRDYLGMNKRDAAGNIIQRKYGTYSQFKAKILKTALDDIERVFDEGKINVYFTMTEIRPRGKQKGTPSYLVFKLHDKKVRVEQQDLFAAQPTDGTQEWQTFLSTFRGEIGQYFPAFTFRGYDGNTLTLASAEWRVRSFNEYADSHPDERRDMQQQINKCFGREVSIVFLYE